jgi:hypothetical protein
MLGCKQSPYFAAAFEGNFQEVEPSTTLKLRRSWFVQSFHGMMKG